MAAHDMAALQRRLAPGMPANALVVALPESLDRMIDSRIRLLTDYQNTAYAGTYRMAVERIRDVERRLVGQGRLELTAAVARNLAKLMAYKDEYEVARLYADPAFAVRLREQFEGEPGKDYELNFYLAPPLVARRDADGHLLKRRYGAWMLNGFRLLAKLKGLRGTFLDPFGKTAERQMERQLARDYLELVNRFCASMDARRLPIAIELAELPEQIRGFGHVKERHVAAAEKKRSELLRRYESEETTKVAA